MDFSSNSVVAAGGRPWTSTSSVTCGGTASSGCGSSGCCSAATSSAGRAGTTCWVAHRLQPGLRRRYLVPGRDD